MMNVFNSLHEYHKPFIFITSQMSNMPGAYGQLKAIGEYYTRSLNGLIVKLWNVYGPEDHCTEDKRHAITDFILAAAKDLKIKMLSDGREERQFLYVDDCCEALATLMNNYKNLDRSKIYDISTGEWVTIHETAQVVSELFGGIPVIQGKAGNNIQAGFRNEPNDNIKPYWTPKISLREGIKRVVDRYNKVGLI